MKTAIGAFFLILFTNLSFSQSNRIISSEDFTNLIGSWKGILTYIDYSSGKPYTMNANVDVSQIGNSNLFIFSNNYPQEKNANSNDTLKISKDGKYFGREQVKSRKNFKNGDLIIITEEQGQDGNDNRSALFKHTYFISKTIFKIRKDVLFKGSQKWIIRHEYRYKKA